MKETPQKLSCTIASQLDKLHCADELTEKLAKKVRLDMDQKNNLAIAVTEAVGNAIVHGNKEDPEKSVHIELSFDTKQIRVKICDEGPGFNPESLADPLLPENLMKENGRGIFILNQLMDHVHWKFTGKGTELHMTLNIKS